MDWKLISTGEDGVSRAVFLYGCVDASALHFSITACGNTGCPCGIFP
jgi:hypothetical protein